MDSRSHRTGMECLRCILEQQRWRPEHPDWDRAVFGAGSFTSRIAFIAEAPGDTEVQQGEPLVGSTGWWFKCLIEDAGLRLPDVWRTNALLCQPRGKGSELKGSEWTAVACCRPGLQAEIAWLLEQGIRVFVPMGAAAWGAILPDAPYNLAKARGYVFPLRGAAPGAVVIPTLHPSPRNLHGDTMDGWTLVVSDIRKAKRIADRGRPDPGFTERTFRPTLAQVGAWLQGPPRPLVIDVENTQDGRLVCLCLCDGKRTLVVPFLVQGGLSYWQGEEERAVRGMLAAVFSNPAWTKIGQNLIHDDTILAQNGLPVKGWVLDTMLADHACYPDQRHSLHHLGSRYEETEPWKPGAQRVETTEPEESK